MLQRQLLCAAVDPRRPSPRIRGAPGVPSWKLPAGPKVPEEEGGREAPIFNAEDVRLRPAPAFSVSWRPADVQILGMLLQAPSCSGRVQTCSVSVQACNRPPGMTQP